MSFRTKSVSVPCPVTKYITWRAKEGVFRYYDRDKGENVDIKLPISFVVLEDYCSIDGNTENGRIFSNKIKNFKKDILHVNIAGEIVSGLYENVKEKVKSEGGKLMKNLFAVMDNELVCIQLKGASFAAYSSAKLNDGENEVVVEETLKNKNKLGSWLDPVFKEGDRIDVSSLQTHLEKANPYFDYIDSLNNNNVSTKLEIVGEIEEVEDENEVDEITPEKVNEIFKKDEIKVEDLLF